MPTLVHLTDERASAKILAGGLKVAKNGKGIYCMPVLQNYFITHQWLRELKRSGAKTFVGVYFKIDSSEMVYAGKYGKEHKHLPLGEAIKEIMSLEEPLGYELIIDRKIEPKEIVKMKSLPQNVGWRYYPGSHNTAPCTCDYCIKGTIKGRKTKDRLNPET